MNRQVSYPIFFLVVIVLWVTGTRPSIAKDFTSSVLGTPPAAAALLSPSGTIGPNYNPAYTWGEVGEVTWYYLWVNGPSGNVFRQWYEASAVCSGGTCSVASQVTLGDGNYTWWILTRNDAGYGPWSTGMSFSTSLPTPPIAAALVSPSGSIPSTQPTYIWNEVLDSTQGDAATWYYLFVNGPSGTVHDQWYQASGVCNGETCSITPDVTLSSDNYTWWILTWNDAGYGPWSTGMNFSSSAQGTTYYVSTSGNDSNPGTQTSPWKTISKVNDQMSTLRPGDSILFKRGDIWGLNSGGESGSLVISASGSAGNPIIFGAYGEGNPPIFDGINMEDTGTMWKGEIVLDNVSYVTIEYIDLYNAIKQHIGMGAGGGNSNHITIQNCTIRTNRTDGFMNIYIQNNDTPGLTNNIIISDNHIYDSKWNGMRITGGVANVFIYGNVIHDVTHNGIDTYPSNSNNTNFQIYGNNIYNFGKGASGAGIYMPGTNNVEVFDNDLHDSQGTSDTYGIKFGSVIGFVNEGAVARNNRIWNVNSPDNNTYGLWFDHCTNCSVLNNTLYANINTLLNLSNANILVKNNLAYANVRDQNSMRNYTQDPQFVNAATGDFHIQPNSPACTAGEEGAYIGAFPCQ